MQGDVGEDFLKVVGSRYRMGTMTLQEAAAASTDFVSCYRFGIWNDFNNHPSLRDAGQRFVWYANLYYQNYFQKS